MSKWLYDPEMDSRNGKEFTYNLPIHENDTLFNGFTYREIMDVVVANVVTMSQKRNLIKS